MVYSIKSYWLKTQAIVLVINLALLTPLTANAASLAWHHSTHNIIPRLKPTFVPDRDIILIRGRINSTVFVDARKQGVPRKIIHDYIKIFEASINFQKDIDRGDSFEILFDVKRNRKGHIIKPGTLLYAGLTTDKKTKAYYHYNRGSKRGHYYSAKGMAPYPGLGTRPVKHARLTSSFGRRIHPKTQRSQKHNGIDLAVKSGTPIYAAGSGQIINAKYDGAYGNVIQIQHGRNYRTVYAHLKAFSPNVQPGWAIKRGQIIGYVGRTGRTTGSHLHYEIRRGKQAINPAIIAKFGDWSITGSEKQAFGNRKVHIDALREHIRKKDKRS